MENSGLSINPTYMRLNSNSDHKNPPCRLAVSTLTWLSSNSAKRSTGFRRSSKGPTQSQSSRGSQTSLCPSPPFSLETSSSLICHTTIGKKWDPTLWTTTTPTRPSRSPAMTQATISWLAFANSPVICNQQRRHALSCRTSKSSTTPSTAISIIRLP